MKLLNDTGHIAELFSSESGEDRIHASLMVRTRHRLGPDGVLRETVGDERLDDIRRDRVEDDYGRIEPDLGFGRTGTDVIVLGDAVAPYGAPTTSMRVALAVGPYAMTLRVVGDRVWEAYPGTTELGPTGPTPFTRMPLTWANAYGGTVTTEYGELAQPNNPKGKGFATTAANALGRSLPNITDDAVPFRRWSDTPEPVGFAPYPTEWALRLTRVCVANETTRALELRPEGGLFDRAHPRLSGQEVQAGAVFSLLGMAEWGEVRFVVPTCPVQCHIRVGDREMLRSLALEELLVDMRTLWVECTYRKMFKYTVHQGELRRTTLLPTTTDRTMEIPG